MTFTDTDNLLLLIQRVGDVDADTGDPVLPGSPGTNGIVLRNASRIWNKYSDRLQIAPPSLGAQIFDQYFMIDATQLVIGVLESRVDFSAVGTAMRVQLSQRIEARNAQMERFATRLAALEARSAALVPPGQAAIVANNPINPPLPGERSSPSGNPFIADANDPRYSGSPYWRGTPRWP